MKKITFRNAVLQTAQIPARILGKKMFGHLILFLARVGQIDLLTFAYNRIGILNSGNNIVSGESFIIKQILKNELTGKEPVLLDVGANKGDYAEALYGEFPHAKIFAFEPTLTAYELLKKKNLGSNVMIFNLGLGEKKTAQKIYSYGHDTGSAHSSMFKEVLTDLHHSSETKEMDFMCTTIDNFCTENNISFIDFLKIDTEGNELNILKGASRMLKGDKVNFIQFEFNEMNIISRVFLRDFYDILKQYEFYRLSEERLIPLGAYNSLNEIFKFQNILAVNRNINN